MTVDPKWLAAQAARHARAGDRLCACGFNVLGLRIGEPCPRCGAAVTPNPRAAARVPRFEAFPDAVLDRLARAGTFLAWGMTLISGGFLAAWLVGIVRVVGPDVPRAAATVALLGAALPGSVLWLIGAVLVTRRETPDAEPSPANLVAGRGRWFGWSAGPGQGLWVAGVGLAVGSGAAGGHETGTGLALAGVSAVLIAWASVSAGPLMVVLRDLAQFARDDYATNRFQNMAVGLPVVAVVLAALPFLPYALGMDYLRLIIGLGVTSLVLIPPVWLLNAGLWSLASSCRWARESAGESAAKDDRLRARAERAARAGGGGAERAAARGRGG